MSARIQHLYSKSRPIDEIAATSTVITKCILLYDIDNYTTPGLAARAAPDSTGRVGGRAFRAEDIQRPGPRFDGCPAWAVFFIPECAAEWFLF